MIHSFNSDFFCIFALYMRRGVLFDYFFSDFAVTGNLLSVNEYCTVTANCKKIFHLNESNIFILKLHVLGKRNKFHKFVSQTCEI